MKYLFLILLLLEANHGFAQKDNCDDIIIFDRVTGRCGGMLLDWQDSITISGIVVDTNGKPLECATIYALDKNDITIISWGTKTDNHGRFTLVAMKSTGMHLHINKYGYSKFNKELDNYDNTFFKIVLKLYQIVKSKDE